MDRINTFKRSTGVIGDVINAGIISVARDGIDITLDGSGRAGDIKNSGTITSTDSATLFVGLYGNSSVNSVVNTGSMLAIVTSMASTTLNLTQRRNTMPSSPVRPPAP